MGESQRRSTAAITFVTIEALMVSRRRQVAEAERWSHIFPLPRKRKVLSIVGWCWRLLPLKLSAFSAAPAGKLSIPAVVYGAGSSIVITARMNRSAPEG